MMLALIKNLIVMLWMEMRSTTIKKKKRIEFFEIRKVMENYLKTVIELTWSISQGIDMF